MFSEGVEIKVLCDRGFEVGRNPRPHLKSLFNPVMKESQKKDDSLLPNLSSPIFLNQLCCSIKSLPFNFSLPPLSLIVPALSGADVKPKRGTRGGGSIMMSDWFKIQACYEHTFIWPSKQSYVWLTLKITFWCRLNSFIPSWFVEMLSCRQFTSPHHQEGNCKKSQKILFILLENNVSLCSCIIKGFTRHSFVEYFSLCKYLIISLHLGNKSEKGCTQSERSYSKSLVLHVYLEVLQKKILCWSNSKRPIFIVIKCSVSAAVILVALSRD